MRAPLEAALGAVAARLSSHDVPFLLGGSALLDALGLDVEVRDVDLMLRPEDRAAFEEACGEWLVSVTTAPGAVLTSAWKATLDVDGVEVEGLGGLGFSGGPAVPCRAARGPPRALTNVNGGWYYARCAVSLNDRSRRWPNGNATIRVIEQLSAWMNANGRDFVTWRHSSPITPPCRTAAPIPPGPMAESIASSPAPTRAARLSIDSAPGI